MLDDERDNRNTPHSDDTLPEDGFYHDSTFDDAYLSTPTDFPEREQPYEAVPPSSAPTPLPSRKSKARERHERRQGLGGKNPFKLFSSSGDTDRLSDTKPMTVTSTADTPHSVPRVPRERSERTPRSRQQAVSRTRLQQVVPAGTPKAGSILEKLPIPIMRLGAYALGAVVLFFGVIILLDRFKDDTPISEPNAIWIGTEWTYDNPGEEAVAAFVQRLRDHKIGTVYAWVSWYTPGGTWGGSGDGTRPFSDRESSVTTFVNQFKAAYPEATLYAWLGVPVEDASIPIPYRMNDKVLQDSLAQFSLRTIKEFGFDGVFLNVEPVWNSGANDFITLINRVRLEIGDSALIAVAVPPDWTPIGVNIPQPERVTPGTVWDKQFKQRVALLTDQMAIMAYNSGLRSPFDYIEWMAYQVQAYAEAVNEVNGNAQILIGIPTYDNELPGHDVLVENVSSAVNGIKKGLVSAGDAAKVIIGIAIYASWATDDTEWAQFQQGWVNR